MAKSLADDLTDGLRSHSCCLILFQCETFKGIDVVSMWNIQSSALAVPLLWWSTCGYGLGIASEMQALPTTTLQRKPIFWEVVVCENGKIPWVRWTHQGSAGWYGYIPGCLVGQSQRSWSPSHSLNWVWEVGEHRTSVLIYKCVGIGFGE